MNATLTAAQASTMLIFLVIKNFFTTQALAMHLLKLSRLEQFSTKNNFNDQLVIGTGQFRLNKSKNYIDTFADNVIADFTRTDCNKFFTYTNYL